MLLNKPRAFEVMDRYGLDGLLAATRQNIYYLTDHWGYSSRVERTFMNYAILPRDETAPAGLVLGSTEAGTLANEPTWVPNVVVVTGRVSPTAGNVAEVNRERELNPMSIYLTREGATLTEDEQRWTDLAMSRKGSLVATPVEGLKMLVGDAGLTTGTIGTDDPRLVTWLNDMGMPGVKGIDASDVFREIRMVKTEDEIALLRQSARANEAAVEKTISAIEEGATLEELDREYMLEMIRLGGRGVYILVGMVPGMRHGKVARGEPFLIDALGVYKHYHGDLGRTIHLGEPSAEVIQRDRAMQGGWQFACERVRPGVRASEIVREFMDFMHKNGFPAFNHAVAHTVGLEHTDHPLHLVHEAPGSESDFVLEENMVLNFDMPFQEFGWGSMHIEDTLRVTKNGFEPLTSLRTEMRVLD